MYYSSRPVVQQTCCAVTSISWVYILSFAVIKYWWSKCDDRSATSKLQLFSCRYARLTFLGLLLNTVIMLKRLNSWPWKMNSQKIPRGSLRVWKLFIVSFLMKRVLLAFKGKLFSTTETNEWDFIFFPRVKQNDSTSRRKRSLSDRSRLKPKNIRFTTIYRYNLMSRHPFVRP